jgi:3'-phosphoadenosine 5'-phosphosulfate sulfotransferase (PAPS reductase)/FAD synthetase
MEYADKHSFDFRAVFADTGNEHEATLEYVADLSRLTGGPEVEVIKADFTADIERKRRTIKDTTRKKPWSAEAAERALEVLHPTGKPFLDLCLWKGRFPSRKAQFCTEQLKALPIIQQVVFPALRGGPVLQWIGVRAQESAIRAKQPKLERQDTGAYLWRPIHKWAVEDVFAIHNRHGIKPNPLYSQGMGRVGCTPCINCRKSELSEIANRFPAHIQRIAAWEQLVTAASKRGGASFLSSSNDPLGGNGYGYTINDAADWAKTSRGGRQFDLLDACEDIPQCSSIYGLCDDFDTTHQAAE